MCLLHLIGTSTSTAPAAAAAAAATAPSKVYPHYCALEAHKAQYGLTAVQHKECEGYQPGMPPQYMDAAKLG